MTESAKSKTDILAEVPDREKLERQFKVAQMISRPVLAMVILADLFLLSEFLFFGNEDLWLWLFVSVSIISGAYWLSFIGLILQYRVNLASLDEGEMIGKYSVQEMKSLVAEVLEPYKNRELPSIYITHGGETNVMVFNSVFFNRVSVLNAVFISEPFFHIFEEGEFKAIISHELGHFYKYTSYVSRLKSFVLFFIGALPIYLYAISETATIWSLIGTWFLTVILGLILFVMLDPDRAQEYLCDYYAAERYGKLNVINALLSFGKRNELELLIVSMIVNRIRVDDTLSIDQTDDILHAIDKLLPDKKVVAEKELKQTVAHFFESDAIEPFRTQLSDDDVKFEEQQIENFLDEFFDNKDFQLLDWGLFDFAEQNMRIDSAEYPYLIDALLKHPDGQLFNLKTDNKEHTEYDTHPTVGQRILFLEKTGVA